MRIFIKKFMWAIISVLVGCIKSPTQLILSEIGTLNQTSKDAFVVINIKDHRPNVIKQSLSPSVLPGNYNYEITFQKVIDGKLYRAQILLSDNATEFAAPTSARARILQLEKGQKIELLLELPRFTFESGQVQLESTLAP